MVSRIWMRLRTRFDIFVLVWSLICTLTSLQRDLYVLIVRY